MVVGVVTELPVVHGDVTKAVGDADDTLSDSVADDAGDDAVGGALAVAAVLAASVVPVVANVAALVAVVAVLSALAVDGDSADVRSGEPELGVVSDARVVTVVAVATVAGAVDVEAIDAVDSELGVAESDETGDDVVLDNASVLAETVLADDAPIVRADAVGVATGVSDVANVAGVAGVLAVTEDAADADASAVPVLVAVGAVPADIEVADG